MLSITIPKQRLWNEATEQFINIPQKTLQLEHSLVSLSKWESKWGKPFLDEKTAKTAEETLDYVRCMTLTQNVDPVVYYGLTPENFDEIDRYIQAPMTATWFSDKNNKRYSRQIITAELIYYWMVAQQIPFECQKWHLNRLITLIRVCAEMNQPKKNMSKRDIMAQNAALNAARRARLHSKG